MVCAVVCAARHQPDGDVGGVERHEGRAGDRALVAYVVHDDPEPLEARQRGRPDLGTVLADAGGEDDGVDGAEHGVVGADVLADPVAVHVERERRPHVTGRAETHHLAEVVLPGQPLQPGLAVERAVDVLERPAERAVQVHVYRGVEVPRTRPHHQALQRRQPHRRVHRGPTAYGGRGRTVAEVQHDHVHVLDATTERPRRLARDVRVRGAVEPVPADVVLLAPGPRDGVRVRDLRDRVVEGGVEDHHLRQVREQLAGHLDALEVGRVVQRREGHQVGDRGHHVVVDQRGLGEPLAAVHHPVPDGNDSRRGQRRPVRLERVERRLERLLEGRELPLVGVLLPVDLVREPAARLADPLDRPRGG